MSLPPFFFSSFFSSPANDGAVKATSIAIARKPIRKRFIRSHLLSVSELCLPEGAPGVSKAGAGRQAARKSLELNEFDVRCAQMAEGTTASDCGGMVRERLNCLTPSSSVERSLKQTGFWTVQKRRTGRFSSLALRVLGLETGINRARRSEKSDLSFSRTSHASGVDGCTLKGRSHPGGR